MSNALIAFLLAAGVSVWIYNQVMRRNGNNTQQSVIVSAVTGVIVFIVAITLMSFITH